MYIYIYIQLFTLLQDRIYGFFLHPSSMGGGLFQLRSPGNFLVCSFCCNAPDCCHIGTSAILSVKEEDWVLGFMEN